VTGRLGRVKSFEYTPILGWSLTRYETYISCKRQYFYHYYGKHDVKVDQRKLNELRNLTKVPIEIGNVVHECIAALLGRLIKQPDKPVDVGRFLSYAANKIDDSVGHRSYAEVYYHEGDAVAPENLLPSVKQSLTNFLESERYIWLTQDALECRDHWLVDPPGYGETRISGLKAYCKVDFLFPLRQKLYILDWKTGKHKEQRHSAQLRGYAAWAACHYERSIDQISPIIAYLLPEYEEVGVHLNEYDHEDFARRIRQETAEMYRYCRDVAENIPLDKRSFPLKNNPLNCQYCNYRELCDR
jgi:CRISPR/Cas system-associated exonuclease Cas4 (RecB family)